MLIVLCCVLASSCRVHAAEQRQPLMPLTLLLMMLAVAGFTLYIKMTTVGKGSKSNYCASAKTIINKGKSSRNTLGCLCQGGYATDFHIKWSAFLSRWVVWIFLLPLCVALFTLHLSPRLICWHSFTLRPPPPCVLCYAGDHHCWKGCYWSYTRRDRCSVIYFSFQLFI